MDHPDEHAHHHFGHGMEVRPIGHRLRTVHQVFETLDQAVDTVISGTTAVYSITVRNAGPGTVANAVVTDPAPTNLTCTTATCTAAGGATCPIQTGAALVTALQGVGATVPT